MDKLSLHGLGSETSKNKEEMKILFLIAACSDNYMRFFNLQGISVPLAFKGQDHNGVPLSFDVSADKSLLAVGFEDDSFVTYHFEVKEMGNKIDMMPIMRGVGHRNFVSTLKFDRFFQTNHQKYLQSQVETEAWVHNENLEYLEEDSGSDNKVEDDVGDEGNANLNSYARKHGKVEEEKQMIKNMKSKIKNSVQQSRNQNDSSKT